MEIAIRKMDQRLPETHTKGAQTTSSGIEIIDYPNLKSFIRNLGEWSFTTCMWVAWGYLFIPLFNAFFWIIAGRHFYITIIEEAHYRDAVDMIQNTGWLIFLVFLILRGWGYYNYRRFGKNDRRRSVSSATKKGLGEFFKLAESDVAKLQSQKEVVWEKAYERT